MAKEALHSIQKAEMVVELNVAGYRKKVAEPYPSRALLEEMYKLGIPITFSSDAHHPEQVGLFNEKIISLARDVGYTECIYLKKKQKHFVKF